MINFSLSPNYFVAVIYKFSAVDESTNIKNPSQEIIMSVIIVCLKKDYSKKIMNENYKEK